MVKLYIWLIVLFSLSNVCLSDYTTHEISLAGIEIVEELGSKQGYDALLRHCCSSPNWLVTNIRGAIVAQQTEFDPNQYGRMEHSRRTTDLRPAQISIRFGPYTRGSSPKYETEYFDCISSQQKKMALKIGQEDDLPNRTGWYVFFVIYDNRKNDIGLNHNLITVEVENAFQHIESKLSVDVKKQRAIEMALLTEKAIKDFISEMLVVHGHVSEILEKGYLRCLMPENGISKVKQSTFKIDECRHGHSVISGYTNQKEPGYVTIRTFDVETGEEVGAYANSFRTIEYLGWSKSESPQFYFGRELTVYGDLTRRPIRFEIWFHPIGERKIFDGTKVVETWTR